MTSITQLIRRKRDGKEHTAAEIQLIVDGTSDGSIADYQLSAWLMAVYFSGMSPAETALLTRAMCASGARLDLSSVQRPKVDKHSTGGVGDKVSLILAPIVASCGIAVPMISGRGLGHTGGTVDKLESIPGFIAEMSLSAIQAQVASIGIALAAQTAELVPADRRMYSLRDVTATVESLPLITASILSKKLAEDIDALVMNVTTGRGAFMRKLDDARALAESIRTVCEAGGVRCSTIVTSMDAPLGRRIGNWLEVCEAARMLRGEEEPPLLTEITFALAGACIVAGGKASTLDDGIAVARDAVASGRAWNVFVDVVRKQGGDVDAIEKAHEPSPTEVILANDSGHVASIDPLRIGFLAVELGAGRRALGDAVAPHAGIILYKHIGEFVERGEPLCGVVESRAGVTVDPASVRSCFELTDVPGARA
ncbi:MAG: thymidine phosphorylase, partial [bacterium]|nr:thymidine phosphorylase [Candidatus Kapabacteria bacterium]